MSSAYYEGVEKKGNAMKYQQQIEEANVLERFLYMMEENSVGYLSENDPAFRRFVSKLYQAIDAKATSLRQPH